MSKIQTVTGVVAPESIDISFMHEHLLFGLPGWDLDPGMAFDRQVVMDGVVKELRALKQAGADLLVDLSPIASGRDVNFMVEAATASDMRIVACTGFWSERGMPSHYHPPLKSVDDLEEIFVGELTNGMGTTDVLAGIIKIGTKGEHMTPMEEGLFRAAARASKRTGACITTHISSHLPSPVGVISGREQLKVLIEEEGVEPNRVIIGHCDATRLPEYHLEVAKAGAFVAFDHISDEVGAPYAFANEMRIPWILNLLEHGYERQMIFATDRIMHFLSGGGAQEFTADQLISDFLPMLRTAGVGDDTINTIMVENPRRALAMPD
jgi:predicted metal-dependent phosphotriesterase family hydrolase